MQIHGGFTRLAGDLAFIGKDFVHALGLVRSDVDYQPVQVRFGRILPVVRIPSQFNIVVVLVGDQLERTGSDDIVGEDLLPQRIARKRIKIFLG